MIFGIKKKAASVKKVAAPVGRVVSANAVDGLVGFDIETGGVFDPLGFGKNCPPEQMQWYRAAELKHGRVCMLAAAGQITQHFTHWNDPSGIFDQTSAWGALQQVRELFSILRFPLSQGLIGHLNIPFFFLIVISVIYFLEQIFSTMNVFLCVFMMD